MVAVSTEQLGVMEEPAVKKIGIELPQPNDGVQDEFVRCMNLRQIAKCGRRFGKTFAVALKAVMAFLGICWHCMGEGCVRCDNTGKTRQKRVLYAAPTVEQVDAFWFYISMILEPGIKSKDFKKNENKYFIEIPKTLYRIKAKTAWNAATMRGDWGDLIIMEEYQNWNEDAWDNVVQPMLADTNGTAIFLFTPPSLIKEGVSKAKDPRHATKLYRKYLNDKTGIWKCFYATSFDNPTLSNEALGLLKEGMSEDAFRREMMAIDDEIEASWQVYSKFDPTMNKIKRFKIPDNWPVYSGHDFGTANPAALFVAQVRLPIPEIAPKYLRAGDFVAFAEYAPGAGTSAPQHIAEWKDIMGLDANGQLRKPAKSVGGNLTTEAEVRQLYTNLGWKIDAPEFGKVNLQVDRGIALMEQGQFYVFEDLHHLLAQIFNCMWEIDENKQTLNKIKDEARYHLLACYRYLATILQGRRTFNVGRVYKVLNN